ncbi:MAG: undecaprenyldiphospho-muramoylpentapeptide beta-N-acetylglucosaminyltransferase [Ruminococcaceae bacterium]|nr:undecaprenyldiphospho-muramoylpentapeptide beta-N-acetylglucosaminyltransferase [Oscillospiraceae bacterium]
MRGRFINGEIMRVLITGGGTGGHVNPALAIAEIIKRNQPSSEIAFVGTQKGMENTLVPKAGYHLYHINIQGIRRSLSLSNLKTAYLVLVSPSHAKKIIREFKPDIVIGTGGYVCWPLLKAASSMGIPTIVHESNAIAGVAVKQLKNKLDVIMTNFESTTATLKAKAKIMRVGNPISGDFGRYSKEEARELLGIPQSVKHVVLSCGGSLGAQRMNEAALEVMRDFTSKDESIMHFHASGKRGAEAVRQTAVEYGIADKKNIVISEYIYNMPVLMAAADVVICRAGAMTLSEIAAMGKAAIIIPSPNVTDNHQYKNAKVLSDKGAAILLEEKDMSGKSLCEAVQKLCCDDKLRADMEEKIGAFASRDTDKLIYEEICDLIERKKK